MTSTLGVTFVLDTNLIGRTPAGLAELEELAQARRIRMVRTDVVDTELDACQDDDLRGQLLAISARMPELLGVMVWGHSRWDHGVWGNADDVAMFDRVWSTMQPGRSRADARKNDVRDAMHVWTAIRYGANALLTCDGAGKDKGLLDHDSAVAAEFDGFHIWKPEQAWAFVRRLLERERRREQGLPGG